MNPFDPKPIHDPVAESQKLDANNSVRISPLRRCTLMPQRQAHM